MPESFAGQDPRNPGITDGTGIVPLSEREHKKRACRAFDIEGKCRPSDLRSSRNASSGPPLVRIWQSAPSVGRNASSGASPRRPASNTPAHQGACRASLTGSEIGQHGRVLCALACWTEDVGAGAGQHVVRNSQFKTFKPTSILLLGLDCQIQARTAGFGNPARALRDDLAPYGELLARGPVA